MKNLKISTVITMVMCVILTMAVTSCNEPGVTSQKLNGNESTLPAELKGLKVYNVSLGDGDRVKVAILGETVNSATYKVGKYEESIIILNKQNGKTIKVSQILVENDSMIVCQK